MNLDLITYIAQKTDIGTIVIVGAMLWVMYNRLDAKISAVGNRLDVVDNKLDAKIGSVERRLDNSIQELRKDIQGLDCRLCRLEGAFAAKDFCVFKHQDHVKEKAL